MKQNITTLAQGVMDMARTIFKSYNTFYEMNSTDNGNAVEVEIIWGDWKHDHAFVDWVFRQISGSLIYGERALIEKADERITEEDGSDCYSSIHKFILSD